MNDVASTGRRSINSKYIKYIILVLIFIITAFFVKNIFSSGDSSNQTATSKLTLKPARAFIQLDKDIKIPLLDEDGEDTEALTLRIENVELRDEIIVQGQKATSVAGRMFLVVNIKLTNSLTQGVEVNTKDYLRLGYTGQNESEWLAPDIHNDPVLIQAISTKPTRVAFPVDEGQMKYILQIGEITGDKEKLELEFTK